MWALTKYVIDLLIDQREQILNDGMINKILLYL